MPRRLFDSEFIFGLHDPGGEQVMLDAGRPGWVLFTEELGRDPNDFSGRDYQPYSNRNLGVISRLNHGYYPNGTLPPSSHYASFARRCANFVANSRGCKIWIIGNEMNHAIERPQVFTQALPPVMMPQGEESGSGPTAQPIRLGELARNAATRLTKSFLRTISGGMGSAELFVEEAAPPPAPVAAPPDNTSDADPFLHGVPGRFNALHTALQAAAAPQSDAASAEVITPELYVRCYRLCREAIHAIPGHADDQVLIGAVAPWNNQTTYAGNPNGDWVQYLQDLLRLLGPDGCDGIALHTYTHGSDPNLISDERRMDPPFQERRYHFRTYQDFMRAIPATLRHLPVYLTETDQDDPWLDRNNGWVQRAYGEINAWNQQPGNQPIRALILYRWPNIDRWAIATKPGVIDDFRQALTNDYRWRGSPLSKLGVNARDGVETLDIVNLRRTPGFTAKPGNDVLVQLPAGARLTILNSASRVVDQLTWWQVRTINTNPLLEGWVAEVASNGALLLALIARAPEENPQPPTSGQFRPGDPVRTRDLVRLRRAPGYLNKPASDILSEIPAGRQGTIQDGPRSVDNLVWWQVAITTSAGAVASGWIAERAPNGDVLLEKVSSSPPLTGSFALGELVVTTTAVNVRRTPGLTNKAANDLLAAFEPRATLNILEGPRALDRLDWWRVGGITLSVGEVIGWVAERTPGGEALISRAPKLPGTNIPDRAANSYLGAPFQGTFGIYQLWGENPQIYGRISYDGVPLKGHNGIDFLTPNGTNLLAVDDGTVLEVVPNDPSGLGNYLKLGHAWGESLYAHLQDFSVQPGQAVRRGQVIGRSDNTGFSSGPHLHFALRILPYNRRDGWGGYSDPLPYLNPTDVQLPAYVRDPLPAGMIRPQASPALFTPQRPLAEAPGYAPDRAGVKRP